MKKLIAFCILFVVVLQANTYAQSDVKQSKDDSYGTFCMLTHNVNDTNFYRVDLTQLSTEFKKVYFKYYCLEHDYFNSKFIDYNIIKGEAIVAVPSKYSVADFRHHLANMKKMTDTANFLFDADQKTEYLKSHK